MSNPHDNLARGSHPIPILTPMGLINYDATDPVTKSPPSRENPVSRNPMKELKVRSKHVFQIAISCLVLLATFAQTSGTASVHTQRTPTEEGVLSLMPQLGAADQSDDDDKLDESIRKFGRAAGAAYQCTPDSGKEKLGNDVLHAYSRIGQLFGTNCAFYFAAAFGNGANQPFDKANCGEFIKKLRESRLVPQEAERQIRRSTW